MSHESKRKVWIDKLRDEANIPGTLFVVVGNPRLAILFSDEVIGKSDEEIFALIQERIMQSKGKANDPSIR